MVGPVKNAIPLAQAARRLRLSWAAMYRLVLTGRVGAEQHNGRWYCDEASVQELEAEKSGGGVR